MSQKSSDSFQESPHSINLAETMARDMQMTTNSTYNATQQAEAMVGMMMMQMYFYMGTKVVYLFKK